MLVSHCMEKKLICLTKLVRFVVVRECGAHIMREPCQDSEALTYKASWSFALYNKEMDMFSSGC